jgi:hypothetical protein
MEKCAKIYQLDKRRLLTKTILNEEKTVYLQCCLAIELTFLGPGATPARLGPRSDGPWPLL